LKNHSFTLALIGLVVLLGLAAPRVSVIPERGPETKTTKMKEKIDRNGKNGKKKRKNRQKCKKIKIID
jgi:hypothetical protein